MLQAIDMGWHPLADGAPPDWASAWGEDRFGVYVAFIVAGVTQRMRWIPPGQFHMGSPEAEGGRFVDEGPLHTVTFAAGFWLFDTCCREALWQAVMETAPHPSRGLLFPVTNVSWDDAIAFIGRVNKAVPGLALSLPSEAQWECACRAETPTPYSFGTKIDRTTVNFSSRKGPVEVGSLKANAWGLHEMHGNVFEWCADHWHSSDEGAPADGSPWIGTGAGGAAVRVVRGGSWSYGARIVRSADRSHFDPASRGDYIGFRCARVQ